MRPVNWHDAEVVARRATYRLQLRPGFGFDEAKLKRFAIDPANVWTTTGNK